MDQSPNADHLKKYSGEFEKRPLEATFLQTTWTDYKNIPAHTLFVLGIMTIVFGLIGVFDNGFSSIIVIRILLAICLAFSGYYIYQAKDYFNKYPYLLLLNQLLIPATVFALAFTGEINLGYLVISTIGLTLIYYQFFANKFSLSMTASCLMGTGCILSGYLFLSMSMSEFLMMFGFLIPVNILGMFALRSINCNKRNEFTALVNLQQAIEEKEVLIQDLQIALAEVKTLEGFLPICANCHSIRNDDGFWERVEKYIQDRTEAQFSHSICPDCLKELYPTIYGEKPA